MSKPASEHRRLTQEQLAAEAADRFGPDPLTWAFQCPVCGDIATAAEFPPEQRERISQECIGRHRDALAKLAANDDGRSRTLPDDRGCDFAAYGLIPGPWEIELPGGKTVRCFPLAPPPQAPAEAVAREDDGYAALAAAEDDEDRAFHAAMRERRRDREEHGAEQDGSGGGAQEQAEGEFAYWALWVGEPLILKVLHTFDTALTDAQARAEIEKFDGDMPDEIPWTTDTPYLLEPLTAPRLRMLRRLALGKKPVTWQDAHGFEVADHGVGCRRCGKDLLGHPGQAV